ncbi:hypothetical protein BOTBODRAFT_583203 [Botryobasidium botryosum FD-172 SS1]|uniref:Uncharacterized protein n=1 Tax=Botryobasidium botryosum (strain FD-172 SS1) TaxID=930990 RepID=A0A067MSV8_BOTB1|nr:hypothetical protein BOTBODRAFT_583203 [Botryobasidium botryosum FD-172 SS1]
MLHLFPKKIGRGGRDIQFAPHRCIAKLLSLHEHLKSIIRTARSRRLSAYLRQSTLKVICVAPHASEGVQVPTTEDIQAAIRENIDIPPSDDKYETLIGQLSRNTTFIPSALCNVKANAHYECAMLAYHLQHPDTFPLRYIGTSKPLCFACQTLFKLYNQHARNFNQRPFYFKEMNWKLRPGWVSVDFKADGDGVPQSAIDLLDRIREDMVAEIKVWVQTHVRHKAKVTQEGEAKCKALLATMAARIKEAKLQRCAQMAKGSDASE